MKGSTPPHHNRILKDGQNVLNFNQGDGSEAIGKYVQTFESLLNLIQLKKEYAQKVAFLHGLQPWAHNAILQRNEVHVTC
jgi:hypothetical protein